MTQLIQIWTEPNSTTDSMQVMPAPMQNYLEEYRKKYAPIGETKSQHVPNSDQPTDVQTLLNRYLGNGAATAAIRVQGSSTRPKQDNLLVKDEGDKNHSIIAVQSYEKLKDSNDNIFDDDDLDKTLLPTTVFTQNFRLTVDDIMKKDPQLGNTRKVKAERRLSNPDERSSKNRLRMSKRRASSSSDAYPPGMVPGVDSTLNLRGNLRRQDSNTSNKSVESNTSNKSNVSFKSDILELSDEEFDFDFEIDLNSSKQSDSDSQKLFYQFQLDSDSQRDAESLTGYDEGDDSGCASCRPVSARSGSSTDSSVSLCSKCLSRRTERHATIKELLDSELSYHKDLTLIKTHFHDALLDNGLLDKDVVSSIFENVINLIAVSKKFGDQLSHHLKGLVENGDEYYTEAAIGQLICSFSARFLAFETYCLHYNTAVSLIDQLRKDNELFNLFLEASQNDNIALRRMDLKTFLMIPVQRVMKYPLLLKRLHKATAHSHPDRDTIEQANEKLTNILHHINTQSKLISSLFSNSKDNSKAKKRTSFEIALTKLVLDTLNWKHDEIHFLSSGKIGFLQPGDSQWADKLKTLRFNTAYAVIVSNSHETIPKPRPNRQLLFPKPTAVGCSTALLIIKKRSSRLQVLGEPHYLSNCLVSRNSEFYDVFEIQKYFKESFIIRPVHSIESWYRNLKYFSMVLGGRNFRRRRALPNILLNE